MAVAFRGASSGQNAANGTDVQLTLPGTLASGDGMIAVVTYAGTAITATTPAGWTLLAGPIDKGTVLREYAFQKVAAVGDIGATLTVTASAATATKRLLSMVAYSGSDLTSPVQASNSAVEASAGTTHTTPTATATGSGTWVVEHCSDRGSPGSTDFTAPTGFTERVEEIGTGSGTATAEFSDSNGTVAAGTRGGDVYTGTLSTANAITWTFIVQPNASTPATATPGRVNALASVFTPSVGGVTTALPARVLAITAVGSMTGQAGSTVFPDLTSTVTTVSAPTVALTSSPIVGAETLTLSATVFTPTVTSLATATPEIVLLSTRVPIPLIITLEPEAVFVTDFGTTLTPADPYVPRGLQPMTQVPVGSTVLRVDGLWQVVVYPSEALIASADRVYRGGRRYEITQAEAQELIDAGFGGHIDSEL